MKKTIADIMTELTIEETPVGKGILQPLFTHQFRVTPTGEMDDPIFKMQVISCNRPTLSFDEVIHDGQTYNGKGHWEPLKIVLEEDAQGKLARVIQKQLMCQIDTFSLENPLASEEYKFDVAIELIDPQDGKVVETFDVKGCWIRSTKYAELDYSKSAASTIELEILFDSAGMRAYK